MIKKLRFFLITSVVLGCIAFIWLYLYATSPLDLPQTSTQIEIKPNSSLKSIAQQLIEQGVISDDLPFLILAKVIDKESAIQAGLHTLDVDITPYKLLTSLNKGKAKQDKVTFIEGKTFKVMRAKLAKNKAITHTITDKSDAEVLALLGVDAKYPEGMFFPDTYHVDNATKDVVILKNAYTTMQKKLKQLWEERADGLPYKNSYEALIMASIIEKETGKGSERKTISGVFNNRLKIGMRLQTDPTVIYGMGEKYKGNIRKKDLRKDTPYNTYTRYGLPPTPIAMPGLASIEAALHPAKTKALYFVGKGDGSHKFSSSLAEHNRAVVKYQLKR